jgi:hypothetical protein
MEQKASVAGDARKTFWLAHRTGRVPNVNHGIATPRLWTKDA